MFAETYTVLRSQVNGRYLVAHPQTETRSAFLLVFQDLEQALSYVNAHAPSTAGSWSLEPITTPQVQQMINRWQFAGFGLVEDPLVPNIRFMQLSSDSGSG